MGKLERSIPLRRDPRSPQASPNTESLGAPMSGQTKLHGSISPYAYLIALSQTDTIEQARWMHALDARTEGPSSTDQEGGEKMEIIEKYTKAIENSDADLLKEVFAPRVRVEPPAGPSVDLQ